MARGANNNANLLFGPRKASKAVNSYGSLEQDALNKRAALRAKNGQYEDYQTLLLSGKAEPEVHEAFVEFEMANHLGKLKFHGDNVIQELVQNIVEQLVKNPPSEVPEFDFLDLWPIEAKNSIGLLSELVFYTAAIEPLYKPDKVLELGFRQLQPSSKNKMTTMGLDYELTNVLAHLNQDPNHLKGFDWKEHTRDFRYPQGWFDYQAMDQEISNMNLFNAFPSTLRFDASDKSIYKDLLDEVYGSSFAPEVLLRDVANKMYDNTRKAYAESLATEARTLSDDHFFDLLEPSYRKKMQKGLFKKTIPTFTDQALLFAFDQIVTNALANPGNVDMDKAFSQCLYHYTGIRK